MLTIFTGAPGAGKTAAMVSYLMQIHGSRAIYADGINGLALDHEPIDARKWHELVPDGAIISVDEGQRLWRPTGPGQRVPDEIAAMETHRHRGLDILVTTQNPKLLHQNIRNLCGRHVHIRDMGILGRWWYEWHECCTNPAESWRSAPIKKRYRLNKAAFDQYTSASLHVKPVRSFPWVLAVLGIALLVLIVGVWQTWRIINAKLHPAPAPAALGAPGPAPGVVSQPVAQPGASVVKEKPAYLTDATQFVPRYSGQPDSAPAFDELRKVVVMPRVIGGYCQAGECYCFNQQGRNAGMSSRDCSAWLKSPPFDPYWLPAAPGDSGQLRGGSAARAAAPGQVAS